jgi:hypothetical protein
VTALGRVPAADGERPGDLAHVDVAPRVHGDAVRRREPARRGDLGASPPRQDPAVATVDTDPPVPRLLDGALALRRLALVPAELGDVRPALSVEDEVGRPLGVRPLSEILAVGVEDLDMVPSGPMVMPWVRYVNSPSPQERRKLPSRS